MCFFEDKWNNLCEKLVVYEMLLANNILVLKMTSSNALFCPTDSPEPPHIKLTIRYYQDVFASLEPSNV